MDHILTVSCFINKELINNFISQFIDVFIFMVLELLHLLKTLRTCLASGNSSFRRIDFRFTPDLKEELVMTGIGSKKLLN